MPFQMLRLATLEGIAIEYWDFNPPLEAVYLSRPGMQPVIGLDRRLTRDRCHFRCVLAEELGHHFTTVGNVIPRTYFHHRDRLVTNLAEYRAMSWAASYLMPIESLNKAVLEGAREPQQLASRFLVTEDMIRFRLRMPDVAGPWPENWVDCQG